MKKVIFTIIIILLFIFLIGCTQKETNATDNNIDQLIIQDENINPNEILNQDEIIDEEPKYFWRRIIGEAEKALDPTKCEELIELEYKEKCYISLADLIKDPELCEKTGDRNDYCYLNQAAYWKSPTLCLKSGDFNQLCINDISIILNDHNICKNLEGIQIDTCIMKFSETKKTIEPCKDANNVAVCMGFVAQKLNDIELCRNQEDNYYHDLCFLYLGMEDKNYCDEITLDEWKNDCKD